MAPEQRCARVVRTGLPDVRCGRKAIYAIGMSEYPVCAAHVAKELDTLTKSLPFLAGHQSGGAGTQVTVTRLVP